MNKTGGRRHSQRRARAGNTHREAAEWENAAVPVTRGRRALRHAGRGARFFLFATVPFIVLFGLALALTFVRLKHGPISLSFLVPPIERSINAVLKGYVASVDDAIVQLTDGNRLEFRLRNVRFAEPDGDIVASSPLAALEISRHALLEARLLPSRVELIKPEIFVTYAPGSGLSLSFSELVETSEKPDNQLGAAAQLTQAETKDGVSYVGVGGSGLLKQLDFSQLVRRATSEARGTGSAASFLREFGVRDALLTVDTRGHRSTWQLPEVSIDFDHRGSSSVISGRARVSADSGSWRVAFHTEDNAGETVLRASIRDFLPSALFQTKQDGSLLGYLDLPVGSDATLALSPQGEVRVAHFDVAVGQGRLLTRDRMGRLEPIPVTAGRFKLTYDPAAARIILDPSSVQIAGMAVTLVGNAQAATIDGEPGWSFAINSTEGLLGTGEFAVPPVALERLTATGRILPQRELVQLTKGELSAGGTTFVAEGEASLARQRSGFRFSATSDGMSVQTLKAIWPLGVAPKTRTWIGEHVLTGEVKRFVYRRDTGTYAGTQGAADGSGRRSIAVETGAGSFRPTLKLAPMSVPRALISLENDRFKITAPEGAMKLGSGKVITFSEGRLVAEDVHIEPAQAGVSFKAQADTNGLIELLGNDPVSLIKLRDLPFKSTDGRIDAELELAFPMVKDLKAGQIKTTGTAKLKDGRVQKLLGEYDVQGASVTFNFDNGAVEAKGEAIVRGVLARISWQHIFDAPSDRQPPLRITATLDNTDRRQLGIDLSHILTGDVPVDLQLVRGGASAERKIHVRADLSSAAFALPSISWRKPPGRSAFVEFDIAPAANSSYELQNFRVAGDNVAIEGWVAIGANRRLREFYFPDFSINVVSRLKVQGTLRNDNVWDIKARGTTFDGKDFFKSLFTVGREGGGQGGVRDGGGVELNAQIDNVIGYSETSLRGLKLQASTRDGKLTGLDARGTLDGGGAMAVILDRDGRGHRRIRADSTDAGQAFKLVGFYPNMQKGRVRLEVNVDGRGAADKSGTLWVEDFRVLGDPIVSEVVSSGMDDGRPSISGKTRVVREVFEFDTMRVPFSLGHGQFVLDDAYMKGPLLGGTIRGKVDFTTSRVNLGGTYIPLQGLNNAFGQIPVLGQILSGPRGEGIFGITFAITGAMANPQVIVNPLSLVAPGIFREVFQMTNPSPKVQPRGRETGSMRRRSRGADAPTVAPGTSIDGWTSDTKKP